MTMLLSKQRAHHSRTDHNINGHNRSAPLRAGAPNMWAMSPLIIDRMRCMPHVMSRNVQRTQACKQNRRHVSSFP